MRLSPPPLFRAVLHIGATTAVAAGGGWVFWRLCDTYLDAMELGETAAALSAVAVVSLLAAQHFAATLTTELPRVRRPRELLAAGFVTAGVVSFVVSLVVVTVGAGVIDALGPLRSWRAVPFVIATISQSLGLISDAAAIGLRHHRVMPLRNTATVAARVLVVLAVVVFTGLDASWALWVFAAGGVVSSSFSAAVWLNLLGVSLPRREDFTTLSRGVGPQAVTSLCGALPPQLMPLVVAAAAGTAAAGRFSLTWLLAQLGFAVSPAVSMALLAEGARDPGSLVPRSRRALLLSIGLVVPVAVAFVFVGSTLLKVVGPSASSASTALLLSVFGVALIPDAVSNVSVSVLRVSRLLWYAAFTNVAIATLAIGGGFLFVSRWGLVGAGWGWFCAQVVGAVVGGSLVWRLVVKGQGPVCDPKPELISS